MLSLNRHVRDRVSIATAHGSDTKPSPAMKYIFVDVETNDHPSKRFELRIVTITWLIAQPNGFEEKMENHIVKPDGFRIAPGAERIHGVSEVQARRYGRPIKDVLGRFVTDLQSSGELTIVGHNVDFDIKVIGAELSRNGFSFDIFHLPFICTMQSSGSVCRIPRANGIGYKNPKLQELYLALFGRNFSDAHTSKADVEATARCFFELRRRDVLLTSKSRSEGQSPARATSMGRQSTQNLRRGSASRRTANPQQVASGPDAIASAYPNEQEAWDHLRSIMKDEPPKPKTTHSETARANASIAQLQADAAQEAWEAKHDRPRPKYANLKMTIVVRCPRCSQQLRVPAGKLLDISCRSCAHTFRKFTA